MLSALKVGNFKAFAKEQIIPLSPITLIFGPNSAGKSSILHSLLLYHHAAQTGNVDVRRTRLGGETVDLGGFERYVHGRDEDSTVSFRVESELQSEFTAETKGLNSKVRQRMLEMLMDQGEKISLVLEIEQEREEAEAGTYSVTTPPHIDAFEIEVDGELVLRADYKENDNKSDTYRISRLVVENSSINPILEDTGGDVEHSERWEEEKKWLNLQVQFDGGNLGPSDNPSLHFRRSEDRRRQQEWRVAAAQSESHDDDQTFSATSFSNQLLLELAQIICRVAGEFFQEKATRFKYLAPLRSYPSRRSLRQEDERPGEDWKASGGHAWEVLRDDPEVRRKVNEWLGEDFLETNYRLEADQHYSSRELRSELDKYLNETAVLSLSSYFLDEKDETISSRLSELRDTLIGVAEAAGANMSGLGLAVPIFGALGGALAGYKKRLKDADSQEEIRQAVDSFEYEDLAESWIRQLELDVDTPPSSRELALVDERAETRVSHRDIGTGISQVLPVLAYARAAHEDTVLMEQPELHLHPRLQTRIGDVFIQSMHERGNQFILETHSEHLILRLMRRIRETNEGSLPDNKLPLSPEDLSVVFVEPTERGSSIVRFLEVDSQGDLVDGWPQSFFDEDFKERFGTKV